MYYIFKEIILYFSFHFFKLTFYVLLFWIFIYRHICLFILLIFNFCLWTWPPCIASMLNIRGWNSLLGAEARGALGTVPYSIMCFIMSYLSDLHLIVSCSPSYFRFPPLILSLSCSPSPSLSYSSVAVSSPISAAACPALIPRILRTCSSLRCPLCSHLWYVVKTIYLL